MLQFFSRSSFVQLRRFIHNGRNMDFIPLRSAIMDRVTAPAELNIQLTETEEKICVLLDDCKEHLRTEKGISTSCRIAGGWVRDKVCSSIMLAALFTDLVNSFWDPKAMISMLH